LVALSIDRRRRCLCLASVGRCLYNGVMKMTPGSGEGRELNLRATRLRTNAGRWLLPGLVTLALSLCLPRLPAQAGNPGRLAVSSEAPRATQEAMKILQSGGNAADAAIVAA